MYVLEASELLCIIDIFCFLRDADSALLILELWPFLL